MQTINTNKHLTEQEHKTITWSEYMKERKKEKRKKGNLIHRPKR